MLPPSWKKGWRLVILLAILAVIVWFGYVAFLFDQSVKQSERHDFHYSLDFSCNTTIENVTILLPFPEQDGTPLFTEAHLKENLYGVPGGWNISVENVNGTPLLAIRSDRMVPEYHGYPVAIEPGQSPLPPTRVPGTEYSADTPVLQPVHLGMMLPVNRTIETQNPVGNEPVFAPHGAFIEKAGSTGPYPGKEYTHTIPVYVRYVSDHPAALNIRLSIDGTNSIWKGGWVFNSYTDTVTLDLEQAPGWINAEGILRTREGVYY